MFSQKSEQKSAQEQMLTNPDMMSGMMKQNLVGIVPQVSDIYAFTDRTVELLQDLLTLRINGHINFFRGQSADTRLPETCCALLQIAMGTFVSYFFSGFILGKIPFPLSPSFRLMLQVTPKPASPLQTSSGDGGD